MTMSQLFTRRMMLAMAFLVPSAVLVGWLQEVNNWGPYTLLAVTAVPLIVAILIANSGPIPTRRKTH